MATTGAGASAPAAEIPWKDHPAKKLLLVALRTGDIPADLKEMGPKAVFEKYQHFPEFQGMVYNSKFTSRL